MKRWVLPGQRYSNPPGNTRPVNSTAERSRSQRMAGSVGAPEGASATRCRPAGGDVVDGVAPVEFSGLVVVEGSPMIRNTLGSSRPKGPTGLLRSEWVAPASPDLTPVSKHAAVMRIAARRTCCETPIRWSAGGTRPINRSGPFRLQRSLLDTGDRLRERVTSPPLPAQCVRPG